jgi:hypothetical protein
LATTIKEAFIDNCSSEILSISGHKFSGLPDRPGLPHDLAVCKETFRGLHPQCSHAIFFRQSKLFTTEITEINYGLHFISWRR